jgi:5-(carboxyamino)imidazole ribonucleotide synthase
MNQILISMNNHLKTDKVILPPATIGILGGGQLGRMMALEARAMGYGIVTLDPTVDCPCSHVADDQIQAEFNSVEGAEELAKRSELITYEFENIGANIASHLENNSYLPQGYTLLFKTQNRLREKAAIEEAGGQVAPYLPINKPEDIKEGIERFGYPSVLKTAEGGYDGKGQLVIRNDQDLNEGQRLLLKNPTEWILEKWVPFQKEISVIVARNVGGEVKAFPTSENIHQENILHLSIVPARISPEIEKKANVLAIQLAESFQLVGLLAIEMFLLEDGTLYVNEMAPRPHNSGHYTQQGCLTSQFEQHIRAVCNLPLGDVQLRNPTVMVNILGEHLNQVIQKMPYLDSLSRVHLYGKGEAKPKRKMGHLNVVAENVEEGLNKIKQLNIWNMEEI